MSQRRDHVGASVNHLARNSETVDVLVIGGGVAGLTAALYLARYRRRVVVLTTERSRARWIPRSHNIPGFTDGIGGTAFLENLERQARQLQVDIRIGEVAHLERLDGLFRIDQGEVPLAAPFALVATGVQDVLPDLGGAEAAVRGGQFRICPICDGFESQGKQIAVLGSGAHALREAQFLKTYSNDLTLIALTPLDDALVAQCLENKIDLVAGTAEAISIEDSGGVSFAPPSGPRRRFDTMYLALGCLPQTQLLNRLLAEFDERGALIVDGHQETSVSGLFAAGDVVRGLNQIVVAAAEGAIAATAIHNRLTAALVGR